MHGLGKAPAVKHSAKYNSQERAGMADEEPSLPAFLSSFMYRILHGLPFSQIHLLSYSVPFLLDESSKIYTVSHPFVAWNRTWGQRVETWGATQWLWQMPWRSPWSRKLCKEGQEPQLWYWQPSLHDLPMLWCCSAMSLPFIAEVFCDCIRRWY